MVDRERILGRIDEAEQRAKELEEYLPEAVDIYRSDGLARAAVERTMQVGIEALLDIGRLFVSGLRLGLPGDETKLIQELEGEVLDEEDAELLDEMRGFRNILVHQYGDLDDDRVFEIAVRFPGDARSLVDVYRKALDERAGE